MVTLYGIKTCDTCRRARAWLDQATVDYIWVDLREDGVETRRLEAWHNALGTASLLNRRSTTWRNFSADEQAAAEAAPVAALLEHPTLAKRPILETATETLAGFSAARYEAVFADRDR